MDDLTITLRQPIKVGAAEFTEIHLTEPTVAQLIQASKAGTPLEELARLVQLNGAVPQAVVNQLRQTEFQQAADFFGRFGTATAAAPEHPSLT